MFSSLNLFQTLRCPESQKCTRKGCIFSHGTDVPAPLTLSIPIHKDVPKSTPSSAGNAGATKAQAATIPSKRTVPSSPSVPAATVPSSSSLEPPRKLQKVGGPAKPQAIATTSYTNGGVPVLRINAAQSQIPISTRQTMLKTLYDHFMVLYNNVLPTNPSLAADHALKQEEEVYRKSTKLTYRNAIIQCCAALKRRTIPTTISHPSVGTEGELTSRAETRKAVTSLRLTRKLLDSYIHPVDELIKWGFFTDLPEVSGGTEPSLEGKTAKCERCAQPFQVKRMEEADECIYHWGKLQSTRIGGEKSRVYTCCGRSSDNSEGCTHGHHVFYESKLEELHARHGFTFLNSRAGESQTLDVAALDCEMIYTTGGMRVARVSVVDGAGKEVFDKLVKMDPGVEIIDYNTRFSGVTADTHTKATMDLRDIRRALDAYVDKDTILIGHALDNDLKTLRIIHHRCVDTALLFPHRAGPPYRRSLRDLVREHLQQLIQAGGGTTGHSSLEDAISTLDLVRWHVINKPKPPENSVQK